MLLLAVLAIPVLILSNLILLSNTVNILLLWPLRQDNIAPYHWPLRHWDEADTAMPPVTAKMLCSSPPWRSALFCRVATGDTDALPLPGTLVP